MLLLSFSDQSEQVREVTADAARAIMMGNLSGHGVQAGAPRPAQAPPRGPLLKNWRTKHRPPSSNLLGIMAFCNPRPRSPPVCLLSCPASALCSPMTPTRRYTAIVVLSLVVPPLNSISLTSVVSPFCCSPLSAEPGLREGKQNQGDDEDGTTTLLLPFFFIFFAIGCST